MREKTLKFINDELTNAGIQYEFGEWTSDVPSVYFVGEYEEREAMNEDGLQEVSFILSGTTRGTWMQLEQAKNIIESLFSKTGKTAILGDHTGVAIFYDRASPVPTGDADLKRIEIYLSIKEWSVN